MRRLLFLFVACLSSVAAAQEPATYEVTDEQLQNQLPTQTLQHAKTFALQHPESPVAARAGLDWFVAATSCNHQEEINSARLYLLLEHPLSLQGRFIYGTLAATPAKLGEYLLEEFERADREFDADFLRKYTRVWRLAPPALQGGSSANAAYILSLYAALQLDPAQGNQLSEQQWRAVFSANDKTGDKTAIFEILADGKPNLAAKFHALQKYKSDKLAQAIQRGLFLKLCMRNEARSAELRVHVENLLSARKFTEALTWLEKIPQEEHDPQLAFWHGWALASAGKRAEGAQKLEQLAEVHRDDAWGKLAKILAAAAAAHDQNSARLAEAMHRCLKQYPQQPLQLFEATLTMLDRTKNEEMFKAYLALDATRCFMELVLLKNDVVKLAYRTANGECSLYSAEHKEIRHFARGGTVFVAQATITGSGPTAKFNWNGNFVPKLPDDLNFFVAPLLQSPLMSSLEALQQAIANSAANGTFLERLPDEGLRGSAVWITPAVDSPKLGRDGYTIGANGHLAGMKYDGLRLDNIRLGQAESFAFSPPAWPDVATVHGDEFPPAEAMSIFTSLMKLAMDTPQLAGK